MLNKNKILVATLLSTKGLKGHIKIKTYTEYPEDILEKKVFDDSGIVYNFISINYEGKYLVAKLKNINEVDTAKKLIGVNLYISRDDLEDSNLDNDEYYIVDLIGLMAKDIQGNIIGEVISVDNFGAGDVIEIKQENTSKMLLFNKESVPCVNLQEKYIVVNIVEYEER